MNFLSKKILNDLINPFKKTITKNTITPVYNLAKEIINDVDETLEDDDFLSNQIPEREDEKYSESLKDLIILINDFNFTRDIKYLFWHCTATNINASVSGIENYWKDVLGWKSPGYHLIIKPNGEWTYLLDFNKISNGARGYNSDSIHISYVGGIDSNGKPKDTMTEKQKKVFSIISIMLKQKIINLEIKGHNEVSNKACPCFNVQHFVKNDLINYIF